MIRGGSWNDHPQNARSAYRNDNQPTNRNNDLGFRLLLPPWPPSPSPLSKQDPWT